MDDALNNSFDHLSVPGSANEQPEPVSAGIAASDERDEPSADSLHPCCTHECDVPSADEAPRLTLAPGDEDTEGSSGAGPDVPSVTHEFEAASRVIEALLFSSDAPLSASRLAEFSGVAPSALRWHVAWLNDRYSAARMSFRIEEIARGFQMLTLPEFQPQLRRLHASRAETTLTAAAMESLSIVAYKQPIIRADVEAIRGVACGDVLSRLREAGLIRTVGRAEVVGRPMLYGTTRKFLDLFGLADLKDLPPLEALRLRISPMTTESIPQPVLSAQRAVAGA